LILNISTPKIRLTFCVQLSCIQPETVISKMGNAFYSEDQ